MSSHLLQGVTDTCEEDSGTWSIDRAAALAGTPDPSGKDVVAAMDSVRLMFDDTCSVDVVERQLQKEIIK